MPLSATQSRMRARSSSSRRKRRRTGSRSARSSTSEAVRRRLGEVEQLGDDAEHRVGLAQRAVGEADAQVGRAQLLRERSELVLVLDHLAGAERGLDERRERLDVRAHHDHVARLQGVVLLQQVEDRVAQDLDLSRAAVAGVDLHAAVARGERRPGVGGAGEREAGWGAVGAHVGLDAAEERVGGGLARVMVIDVLVRAEHELHLARVLAPGGEQPVGGERRGGVVGTAHDRRAVTDLLPQRGRGVEEEDVDLAAGREGAQDVEMAGRQPRQAEEREALGKVERARGRLAGARTRARAARPGSACRAARAAAATARPATRPRRERRPSPRAQPHTIAGPVQRVAVEQLREVADGGEAPRAPVGVGPRRPGAGEARQPRLVQALADDVEQRPDGALRQPRVGFGSIPDAAATASPARRRGNGNSMFAQMPSERPGVAPRLADIRCVSQRSIPRVGTAMTSGAKGSASGSARSAAERLDQGVGAFSSVDVQQGASVTRGQAHGSECASHEKSPPTCVPDGAAAAVDSRNRPCAYWGVAVGPAAGLSLKQRADPLDHTPGGVTPGISLMVVALGAGTVLAPRDRPDGPPRRGRSIPCTSRGTSASSRLPSR